MGPRETVQDIKGCRVHAASSPVCYGVPQSKRLWICRQPQYLGHGQQDIGYPEVTLAKHSFGGKTREVYSLSEQGLCRTPLATPKKIGMAGDDSRRQDGEYSRSVDEPRGH